MKKLLIATILLVSTLGISSVGIANADSVTTKVSQSNDSHFCILCFAPCSLTFKECKKFLN